jgi:hypothetical protein
MAFSSNNSWWGTTFLIQTFSGKLMAFSGNNYIQDFFFSFLPFLFPYLTCPASISFIRELRIACTVVQMEREGASVLECPL